MYTTREPKQDPKNPLVYCKDCVHLGATNCGKYTYRYVCHYQTGTKTTPYGIEPVYLGMGANYDNHCKHYKVNIENVIIMIIRAIFGLFIIYIIFYLILSLLGII